MAMETREWGETDDEKWVELGNSQLVIYGPVVHLDGTIGEGIVWQGLAAGWQENATKSLSIRIRVELDEKHVLGFEVHTIAEGRWWRVAPAGYTFDLQAMIDAETAEERQAEEQRTDMERQERERALLPTGPPRAVRRGQGR